MDAQRTLVVKKKTILYPLLDECSRQIATFGEQVDVRHPLLRANLRGLQDLKTSEVFSVPWSFAPRGSFSRARVGRAPAEKVPRFVGGRIVFYWLARLYDGKECEDCMTFV